MADDTSKMDTKLDYLDRTKQLIKQAISNKGISITDDTTFREYADLINNIQPQKDQSDATATPDDIVYGKTAYVNNEKITGNIIKRNSISSEAFSTTETDTNITSSIEIDNQILLDTNSTINITVDYEDLDSYNRAVQKANDILGIE